jgi:hypothetical protein
MSIDLRGGAKPEYELDFAQGTDASCKTTLVNAMKTAGASGRIPFTLTYKGSDGEPTSTTFFICRSSIPFPNNANASKQAGEPSRISITTEGGKNIELTDRKGNSIQGFIFNEGKYTWRTRIANLFRSKENQRGASKMDILTALKNYDELQRIGTNKGTVKQGGGEDLLGVKGKTTAKQPEKSNNKPRSNSQQRTQRETEMKQQKGSSGVDPKMIALSASRNPNVIAKPDQPKL